MAFKFSWRTNVKSGLKAFFMPCFFIACTSPQQEVPSLNEPDNIEFELETFSFPGTTIRAMANKGKDSLFFAGSSGQFGFTFNGGESWKVDTLELSGKNPDFRSIELTESGDLFLVGVSDPAVVMKSADFGATWSVSFEDTSNADLFLDAIAFCDQENGILLGDAQKGCFQVFLTKNAGQSWSKIVCSKLPKALDGENPFAASNTNLSLSGDAVWFGTGGTARSRVYFSPDKGLSWQVFETPIISGQAMTGIFSTHFFDHNIGYVGGGNWEKPDEVGASLALTRDGGKSWELLNKENLGYISWVSTIPYSEGADVFLLSGRARGGESWMAVSQDFGSHWSFFPNENFLSGKFISHESVWLSGKDKIGKLTLKYFKP